MHVLLLCQGKPTLVSGGIRRVLSIQVMWRVSPANLEEYGKPTSCSLLAVVVDILRILRRAVSVFLPTHPLELPGDTPRYLLNAAALVRCSKSGLRTLCTGSLLFQVSRHAPLDLLVPFARAPM